MVRAAPILHWQWAEPDRISRWYIEECNNVIARHCEVFSDTLRVCSLPLGAL